MKIPWLPMLILLMCILYIFIIPNDPYAVKILFKLIPMWLIIYYAYKQVPSKKANTHWLIIVGLFFCMLGDGLLNWFVLGLSAFLIGHIFYFAGFLRKWRFAKIRFTMIIPLAFYGLLIGKEIFAALFRNGQDTLFIPVLIYLIIISFMAWSAIMTGNPWAIIGSILFLISDSILSWNMFVSPVTFSGPLIMTTYYTAQFLIARSIRPVTVLTHKTNDGEITYSNRF